MVISGTPTYSIIPRLFFVFRRWDGDNKSHKTTNIYNTPHEIWSVVPEAGIKGRDK